ncbi:50S ribosomal protein L6 [Dehalococcoides mccartyi]|uniref:Large ribosomal subunit protein uL6 n=1 Tax=Dehalococcoides mccartyi (strain ATCC BAA-2266 / KCTC 15142 / 195) TaxID=243164 RepID=RL6_DEHM1|nr:50S ribosomal protein L6 [Dehalococcoides mccartyi]Q3Z966.1 RecName: Full=Large ribosomal subunit protein uL6; AltName: Full=50S ribosomal protein L6 [Dehalococcoides mccartyi 195]AAW40277.1 ribosomal protein L6 [Dehalococcoides mccartyi 195]
MSRIGKMPIKVPPGVTVDIKGNDVTVKGPKGTLNRTFRPEVTITRDGDYLVVAPVGTDKAARSFFGLSRTLLDNMIVGVKDGFDKNLEIVGVGMRADKDGNNIIFKVGYSHTVTVAPPAGITLSVDGTTKVKVSGINKEEVSQMAAEIRSIRKPDHYMGKGIRYAGEYVRIKPGKAIGKGAK